MRHFRPRPRPAYRTEVDVVELRRYALKPGRRDELIALFEREFVQSQEECGIALVGHYRDIDDPDAFVWLRGFGNMEQRKGALEAFYLRSAAWARNRDAANATMIDSDNVLLLRPARRRSGFGESVSRCDSLAAASIFMLPEPATDDYISDFERAVLPRLQELAGNVAYFVTEPAPNTFARLPVREREWAFVVTGTCGSPEALEAWHGTCAAPESLRLTGTSYRR